MARVVLNLSAYTIASEKAGPLVRQASLAIAKQARENAPGGPYSQGNLKRSIHRERGLVSKDSVTNYVGSDLIYAHSVHEGQPARTIVPVRAPLLRFFWRRVGRRVAFESVRHPGTKGQPYLTRALRTEAPRFGFKTIRYRT